VIDGNPTTIWHTAFSASQPKPPHDLTLRFKKPLAITAIRLTQRQDRNPNGQVAEIEVLTDGKSLTRSKVPANASDFRIPIPGNPILQELTLRIHSSHAGPFASLAELEVEVSSNR
jgi:hexosaminidase